MKYFNVNLREKQGGFQLTEYSQCYLGTSKNIKERIMTHWSTG